MERRAEQTPLQYLLRGLSKLSPHPRDVLVHQEIVAEMVVEGQFGAAMRFLQVVLASDVKR